MLEVSLAMCTLYVTIGSMETKHTSKIWWKCPAGPDHEWEARPTDRGGCPFCAGRRVSQTNGLTTLFPEVAAQWHPTKNGVLTPSQVTAGSSKRVWWRCPLGPDHEWEASPANRTRAGGGCPFDSGKRVSSTNSLAKLFPKVAAQWHPTKNGDLTPDQVVAGSSRKVWWRCSNAADHEWEASPANRIRGAGCPFDSGKRVSGTNNIAAVFPRVAEQWHTTKNGDLTPNQVVAGSNKRYWWQCPVGADHVWYAAASSRTLAGTGCPFCAGQAVSSTNNLLERYPEIAAQWHPVKNGKLTPDQVVTGSHKKAWWKCLAAEHEWCATIASRTHTGYGCPGCARS
jgi:hypothetical protein